MIRVVAVDRTREHGALGDPGGRPPPHQRRLRGSTRQPRTGVNLSDGYRGLTTQPKRVYGLDLSHPFGILNAMYPPFVLNPDELAPLDDVDLVIFPDFVEDGIGVYRHNLIPLKKELAELGVRAEYAYPPDRRTWLRELSASEALLNVAIGLGCRGRDRADRRP